MSNSIKIEGVFIKNKNRKVTDSEINDFVDSVIAMAEEKGFSFSGIVKPSI